MREKSRHNPSITEIVNKGFKECMAEWPHQDFSSEAIAIVKRAMIGDWQTSSEEDESFDRILYYYFNNFYCKFAVDGDERLDPDSGEINVTRECYKRDWRGNNRPEYDVPRFTHFKSYAKELEELKDGTKSPSHHSLSVKYLEQSPREFFEALDECVVEAGLDPAKFQEGIFLYRGYHGSNKDTLCRKQSITRFDTNMPKEEFLREFRRNYFLPVMIKAIEKGYSSLDMTR